VGQPPPAKLNQLNQRPGQTRAGAIEKKPHAQSFSTLHCDQPHLPANVIDVGEVDDERLVGFCVSLQPSDSTLNALTKARADFEAFIGGAIQNHGRLPGITQILGKFLNKVLKFS
jgi:hypothetical protein